MMVCHCFAIKDNYGPGAKGGRIVISVSVHSSVCLSVTDNFFMMGSILCSLLLQNYSTDFSNVDTNLPREQCRFATYTSF